jgi:hypothetical protein
MKSINTDGWELVSAEERNSAHPSTFLIPTREQRENLAPGDGVKLLFDIENRENGRVKGRGMERMWVIVKARKEGEYSGALDNDPVTAENLQLRKGDIITFGPQHVSAISNPPREYVIGKYGASFFDE